MTGCVRFGEIGVAQALKCQARRGGEGSPSDVTLCASLSCNFLASPEW